MTVFPSNGSAEDRHYLEVEFYAQMRANPELINFIESGSLDGLWYWDLENPEHEWLSPRFKATFGYTEEEVPHSSSWWRDNIHPDDLPKVLSALETHRENASEPYDVEVRYRHKNGRTVWIRCRGKIIRDETGTPVRMIGAHSEITALKSREQQLDYLNGVQKTILDTVQHGLMMFEAVRNGEGHIFDLEMIEANAAACELVGRPRDGIVGRYLSETFPGNFEDGLFDTYRQALETGETRQITKHYRHENLDNWYDILASPHSSDMLVISFNDITAHKSAQQELETQQRKFQELYFRTPAIMHSIDETGKIFQVSDTWCEVFGYRRDEVLGRRSTDLLTEESRAFAKDIVLPAFWRDGFCTKIPYTFVRKDGSTFEGELSAVTFVQEGAQGVTKQSFAVIEEVTERNRSRRALEETIDTLNETKSRLETFAYAASHDLQEPLRKIDTFLPMALEADASGDKDTATYARSAIHRAVRRAKQLITALLNYSKSQNRALDLKEISLKQAVISAWHEVLPATADPAPALSHEALDITVVADEIVLEILLTNLFSNAIKYQEKDQTPAVRVWTESDNSGTSLLHIMDNGIGFSEDHLSLIFEPFKRLHTQTEYPGSGIGLATCETICKRLGWQISAQSEPGKGARFSIALAPAPHTP